MAAKKKKPSEARYTEIRNAKARRNYFIEETLEAGIVLQGTEVKSIRAGKAQINDAYVRVEKEAPVLYQAHIDEYRFGNIHNHEPTRPRRLLINRRDLDRLRGAVDAGGRAVVPLRIYLKNGLAKVEIAVCTGKKLHDKRHDLKRKTEMREAQRAVKHRR